MKVSKFVLIATFSFLLICNYPFAQNPKIKCYFNRPVNSNISTGINAVYLNGTFADTVAAYINRAKFTIDIAVYNFTSGSSSVVAKIATAANNARSRGVIIRWVYDGSSTNSGLSLLDTSIKRIGSPTTLGYGIMHNKFVVIDVNSANPDDAIIMTGSYNFSTNQNNSDYNNIVFIQDQPLALAYYNEFNKMWGGVTSQPNTTLSTFGTFKSPSAQTTFNVNGTTVELYFSPKDAAATHLKNAINTADNELFFGIYAFTDNSVANAIKTKVNNGVVAKGIIDQFSQNYSPYPTLNPVMGSKLVLYTGNALYHNKIMVIDADHPQSDPQVETGSYNWSNSGTNTNDENCIIIHDSIIANQYLQSLCQNFADIGGAVCLSALPLNLLYFKGSLQAQKPLLQWSIAANQNVKYFEIEKSSEGIHFAAIAHINCLTNNTTTAYNYRDDTYTNSASYYRLRMIDNDGNSSLSNTIFISSRDKMNLFIFPNPVAEHLYVQLKSDKKETKNLAIADVSGRIILKQTIAINAGMNTISINTNQLAKGTYLLMIDGSGISVEKFMKN